MAKKKEEEQATPQLEPETPKVEVKEEKPAEDVAGMKARLEALETSFKNEQRVSSKKEEEIKQLQNELADREGDRALFKSAMGLYAEQLGKPEEDFEGETKERAPDLIKRFDTLFEGQEQKRKAERYVRQADTIWQRGVTAGLTKGDSEYWELYKALKDGIPEYAEAIVSKVEGAKPVEPKETADETKARLKKEVEEEYRQSLEDKGVLDTAGGAAPAGASSGKVYKTSEIKAMDYQGEAYKTFKEAFPDSSAYLQAVKEGRIVKDN